MGTSRRHGEPPAPRCTGLVAQFDTRESSLLPYCQRADQEGVARSPVADVREALAPLDARIFRRGMTT